jgi:uncharacterized tellurite resistance protein B-like protein
MKLIDSIISWLLAEERFSALTADQSLAVVDSLLAMVMADERITDEEWRRLRREIARLPWAWREEHDEVEERIEDARLRVERLRAEIADGRFARDIAARLPDAPVREAVYRMMVAIAQSDGLEDCEQVELESFRTAFGLTSTCAG